MRVRPQGAEPLLPSSRLAVRHNELGFRLATGITTCSRLRVA